MIEVTKNEEKIAQELLKGPVYYAMVHANGYTSSFVLEASEKSLASFIRLMAGRGKILDITNVNADAVVQITGYEFVISDGEYQEALKKLAAEMNEGNGIFGDFSGIKYLKKSVYDAVLFENYRVVNSCKDRNFLLPDQTEIEFNLIPEEKFSRNNLDRARGSLEISIKKYLAELDIDTHSEGRNLGYLVSEMEKTLYKILS